MKINASELSSFIMFFSFVTSNDWKSSWSSFERIHVMGHLKKLFPRIVHLHEMRQTPHNYRVIIEPWREQRIYTERNYVTFFKQETAKLTLINSTLNIYLKICACVTSYNTVCQITYLFRLTVTLCAFGCKKSSYYYFKTCIQTFKSIFSCFQAPASRVSSSKIRPKTQVFEFGKPG